MKKVLSILLFFVFYLLFARSTFALTFDLIAPSGQLQSGQEVKFTINIDTEGKSYLTTQIGMTYDTQYLEYVSTSVGNTFTTVSANPEAGGKLIISGSSASGYSGSGTFAYVTFKIIAAAPGSTATPIPPTALPTSGDINGVGRGLALGMVFLVLAGGGFFVFRNL